MPDDLNLEVPLERRLEEAGLRLNKLEDDPLIVYMLEESHCRSVGKWTRN
jgi:hypothetical protein